MDPNRLTQKSQEALHDAQTKALRFGHPEVDVEHLALAPLRRFIAREVETRIGRALLAGDARDGAMIRVDLEDSELTVSYHNST
jgi:ATP-dependent Clp protease ATP-binding subunit ClpA